MDSTAISSKGRPHTVTPAFLSVAVAQVFSLFGSAILRFAVPLYVLNLTGSAAQMGIVTACAWVPYLLLTPIGGVLADRMNKRRIMATLDICLAAICVVYTLIEGRVNIIALSIAALMALYAVSSIYQPTVQSAVPFLVPREGIVRATAIVSQISSLSGLVGPVLGGLVFGMFGITPVVMVSSVAFVVSALLIIVFVKMPVAKKQKGEGPLQIVKDDILASVRFFKYDRPAMVKVIVLLAALNMSMSAFIIIGTPVIVTEVLGLTNQFMGFAEGLLAFGGLVGGTVIGVLAKKVSFARSGLLLAGAAAGIVPITFAIVFSQSNLLAYAFLCAGLFVAMAFSSMFSIQTISYIQLNTPQHLVGKVIAVTMAAANCASPLGQLMFGVAFDVLRNNLVAVSAATIAVSLVLAFATTRVARRA